MFMHFLMNWHAKFLFCTENSNKLASPFNFFKLFLNFFSTSWKWEFGCVLAFCHGNQSSKPE